MHIRDVARLARRVAGDGTRLAEILHPERGGGAIRYSLAHASLPPRGASLPHRLGSTEVYYILGGTGVMHVSDESEDVHAGETVLIPAGATQWIENTGDGDLTFLCIVDPAWQVDDEEVLA